MAEKLDDASGGRVSAERDRDILQDQSRVSVLEISPVIQRVTCQALVFRLVIPARARIQIAALNSRLRGNNGQREFQVDTE